MHLNVLPLEIAENVLVPQKCLLPRREFPGGSAAGAWAKCFLAAAAGGRRCRFSVCQLFPRDFPTNFTGCYLDAAVLGGDSAAAGADLHVEDMQLSGVELLPSPDLPAAARPHEVTVLLVVTDKLFSARPSQLSSAHLGSAVQQLLQHLALMVGCVATAPQLQQLGIASVHVQAASDGAGRPFAQNALFRIAETTLVGVHDVRLHPATPTAARRHCTRHGLERAREALQDLVNAAQVRRQLQSHMRQPLNALIVGAPGAGKSTLVDAVVADNHCNCFRITVASVLGQYPGETEAALRRIFGAAHVFVERLEPKAPTVIFLDDIHLLCPAVEQTSSQPSGDSANAMRVCSQLLALIDDTQKRASGVLCLAATSQPDRLSQLVRRPGRFEREILIEPPSVAERKQLFAALLCEALRAANIDAAIPADLLNAVGAQTQGYVAADLALLVDHLTHTLTRSTANRERDLHSAFRAALHRSKPMSVRGADVSVVRTQQGFDAIGGMQRLKRSLAVSVLAGLRQHAAFRRFGLNLPKGVLLYGPPGCAKTTVAKCLAAEANMTFIATSGAEVYSPYVGCAERFVAKIFDAARKNAPALIFLDEIDALVGRRAIDAGGSSDVQMRILSTLLTEMDGVSSTTTTTTTTTPTTPASGVENEKHILVVAATNRPDMLDDALMRPGRFDRLVHVPAPDAESRHAILQLYAGRMPFAADVDLAAVAHQTHNFSGADMCNLCNEAAMQAFQCDFDATQITAAHFASVLCTQKSSLTQRQIDWYYDFERKFVAA